MEFTELKEAYLPGFIDFCRRNRGLLDDSYLGDEDLASFSIGPRNPTSIKVSAAGEVVGAFSVILDDRAIGSGRARIRILHSESGKPYSLKKLVKTLVSKLEGMEALYVFCPDVNQELIGLLEGMGFRLERLVLRMVLDSSERKRLGLPAGYVMRHFRAGHDEGAWCNIRNSAFEHVKGNRPVAPEEVSRMAEDPYSTNGGMLVLFCDGEPVGVACGEKDEFMGKPIVSIGPVAVLPDHQGKGLGRALLRAVIIRALDEGIGAAYLSVNSDNLSAVGLYASEGFKKEKGFACHVLDLRDPENGPF